MKLKPFELFLAALKTILILSALEVLSSVIFPLLGLSNYILPFHVLIVLYLAFKIESPYIAALIFILEYTHSLFSIEGWEMGTVAGVVIAILISYVRELINLSSYISTAIITEIFLMIWFALIALLLSIQVDSIYIANRFYYFLFQSVVLSLLAPFIFSILDRFWKVELRGTIGDAN